MPDEFSDTASGPPTPELGSQGKVTCQIRIQLRGSDPDPELLLNGSGGQDHIDCFSSGYIRWQNKVTIRGSRWVFDRDPDPVFLGIPIRMYFNNSRTQGKLLCIMEAAKKVIFLVVGPLRGRRER